MSKQQQHPTIIFDPSTAIAVEEALVNSYGLDLTNTDYLKFHQSNITIEVIGGVNDLVLTQLKVTLKIYQKGNTSPTAIFRSQQIDLFNEHQLEHFIRNASERIRVESIKIKEAVYDLAEKLERYRLDKTIESKQPEVSSRVSTNAAKEVKSYLKQNNLLQKLTKTIETAGVPDGELGLKLMLLALSRITITPIHTIVQGNLLLSNEMIKTILPMFPDEQLREATSISKNALSYPPYQDYWQHKTLVLHQLDATLGKDSLVEEYINSGQLKRIVTEDNHKIGVRRSGEKNNQDTFGILSYTNRDFLPIFNAHNVICLPLTDPKQLQSKFYDLEIRKHAGMLNEAEQHNAVQLLVNLQRSIRPLKVTNPYFEQIDFEPFFQNDLKQIKLFLQLTNLITLLHQEQLAKTKENNKLCIEVQPQFMIAVLELFKDVWLTKDEELYFRVLSTYNKLKAALKKQFKKDAEQQEFFAKDYRKQVGLSPSTFAKHIKQLDSYGKLKRVGGNNRTGYQYQVVCWDDETNNVVLYQQLLEQLNKL
jgi:hypothetical protein